jgi:hypothetical protein
MASKRIGLEELIIYTNQMFSQMETKDYFSTEFADKFENMNDEVRN